MELLSQYIDKFNIENKISILKKFEIYYSMLIEYNKKFNLTGIVEKQEVETLHFIDSLLGAEFISGIKVMDVGSGAGFPILPLKIINPSLQVTIIDSTKKRIGFIQEVIKALYIPSTTVLHARAEELGTMPAYREKFDTVVSRAVAPMNQLLEFCLPLVKVGGKFIAYKGDNVQADCSLAKKAFPLLGGSEKIVQRELFGTDIIRSFVVVDKIKATPSDYPRAGGKIAKFPL